MLAKTSCDLYLFHHRYTSTLQFLDFSKFYNPPTNSFGDVFLLKEHLSSSGIHFILGGIIELVSFSFLRIPTKVHLSNLGPSLSEIKCFIETIQILHKRHIDYCANSYLIWCLFNGLWWNTVKCKHYYEQSISLERVRKIWLTHHQSYHVRQSVISPLGHIIRLCIPRGVSWDTISHSFKQSSISCHFMKKFMKLIVQCFYI